MTRGRKTARVVATPGTMSGQPRIDGTRMTVTQLLIHLRGGMTVDEISATWPHLSAGWFDAIVEWIDGQAVPDVPDAEAVQAILDAIPDAPPEPGDELPADYVDRHGGEWALQRDPGETDDEFARRRELFAMHARAARADANAVEQVLDRIPDVPPEPGGENNGAVARDLGISQPEAIQFKWNLARGLALEMENRGIDAFTLTRLAGDIEPEQIRRITEGLVADVDTYEIMRLLKVLDYRFYLDIMPPAEGEEGIMRFDPMPVGPYR